jgi:sugar/nucleoside kinase (ribokinase family)
MGTVVVGGTLCLDLVPSLPQDVGLAPGQLLDVGPLLLQAGGCVSNTGGDLCDLGITVRALGVIGDDDLGVALRARMQARGIDDRGVVAVSGATTSYSIVLEPAGIDRTFWHHMGANAWFEASLVTWQGAEILHIGYPPLLPRLLADHGAALAGMFAEARAEGVTTSLDFAAVRSGSPRVDWRRVLRVVLPQTDLLSPSADDLASMLGRPIARTVASLGAVAGELIELGAAAVMMTAGADGAVLRTATAGRFGCAGTALAELTESWPQAACDAAAARSAAASTRGAGDAATAGFLCAVLKRLDPAMTLDLAMWAAGHRVDGVGRLPPYNSWQSQSQSQSQSARPMRGGHGAEHEVGFD